MAAYDATTKFLIEHHAADWLALAGLTVGARPVRVVDADLSTVTSASDKLVRVGRRLVIHLELQSGPDRRLDERVLAYNVLARRRHGVPVHSVVFLLRPAAGPPSVRGAVRWSEGSPLSFDYQLVRVWELPAAELLAGGLGTLPLAPIAAVGPAGVADVIGRMRYRLDREADAAQAGELWTATRILMGLRYNGPEIRTLMQGVRHMRESVTYQEIVDEGRVEGDQQMLLRLGTAKFGRPPAGLLARLRAVTSVAELERLGVRLLTAPSWDQWLPAKAARPTPRRRRTAAS